MHRAETAYVARWLYRLVLLAVGLPLSLLLVGAILSVVGSETKVTARGIIVPSNQDPGARASTGFEVMAGVATADIDALTGRIEPAKPIIVRYKTTTGAATVVARLVSISDQVVPSSEVTGSDETWPPFVYPTILELPRLPMNHVEQPGDWFSTGTPVDVEFRLGWESFLQQFVFALIRVEPKRCFGV